MAELEEKLGATGAGSFQLRQIRDALARVRSSDSDAVREDAATAAKHLASNGPSSSAEGGDGLVVPSWEGKKKYAAFLSHHQRDSAMESRYLKEQLEGMLGNGVEIFLDFDNLQDLHELLRHVRNSDVFVILLTSEVLLRPWCILEIHAAVSAGIPIVGVTLRGKGYDHQVAQRQLIFLDTELDRSNPGALAVLKENGLDPVDAAYLLSNVIPRLVPVEINPAASSGALQGGLLDLVETTLE